MESDSSQIRQVTDVIRTLAAESAAKLRAQMGARQAELDAGDTSHHLIYRVLGVPAEDGHLIDRYQNTGRLLYRHAGSFLERATRACFEARFPTCRSARVRNTKGQTPRTFEIDCLVDDRLAIEIKWRDATTDGDHIAKERMRLLTVAEAGYQPIRLMFYHPRGTSARRIQRALEALHQELGGRYLAGDAAWSYVASETGIDLARILEDLAEEHPS